MRARLFFGALIHLPDAARLLYRELYYLKQETRVTANGYRYKVLPSPGAELIRMSDKFSECEPGSAPGILSSLIAFNCPLTYYSARTEKWETALVEMSGRYIIPNTGCMKPFKMREKWIVSAHVSRRDLRSFIADLTT